MQARDICICTERITLPTSLCFSSFVCMTLPHRKSLLQFKFTERDFRKSTTKDSANHNCHAFAMSLRSHKKDLNHSQTISFSLAYLFNHLASNGRRLVWSSSHDRLWVFHSVWLSDQALSLPVIHQPVVRSDTNPSWYIHSPS